MINKILDYLDELYPNPKCELEYTKDYELLIAIVMSAQTTLPGLSTLYMLYKGPYSQYHSFHPQYSLYYP